jgi:heat shock protein HslJ
MKIILGVCIGCLLACQGPGNTVPATDDNISVSAASLKVVADTTTLGGEWYLQPVLPSDTASGKIPTLWLNPAKTHFSGNTGCNAMNGTFWYSGKDSSLSFSDQFVTTKMRCPGYNEGAFVKSLMNTNHFRLQKGLLILMTDNTELSRWGRRPAAISKTGKA